MSIIIFLLLSSTLYEEALNSYTKGDFELARKKIEQFLIKCPSAEVTPEALYLAAKLRKKSIEAVNYYEKIASIYSDIGVVSDALYNIAQYYYTKRDYCNAVVTCKKVVSDYPNSKSVELAKKLIERMQAFYFIQVGSFSKFENANRLAKKLKDFNPIIIKDNEMHKVWIGPFPSSDGSKDFMLSAGFKGFVTRIK